MGARELLSYAAWGAVLVYAGAFFIQAQHVSARDAGLLLGVAATGFLPGTLLTRRWAEAHMRAMLVGFGLAAAGTVVLLDTLPLPTAGRTLLLGVLMFAIGARTMAAGAFGLHETPDRRAAAMGIRAAAMQLGNLAGAAAGGAAIATGGFPALGVLAGGLFALGTAPHLLPRRPRSRAECSFPPRSGMTAATLSSDRMRRAARTVLEAEAAAARPP
jgi:predicted MFS family arabinose efflux permease